MRIEQAGSAARIDPREPTAAQNALSCLEALVDDLRRVKDAVEEIADHLGQLPKAVNTQDGDAKTALRPARSGIIGAMHGTADHGRELAGQIESLVKRISTQV